MGTDIKIQKRISIQNEGVTVIPDVSNLNFLGNGVHASSSGTVVIDGVTTRSFYDQFMTNQYMYFLPADNSALYNTLRAGGALTSSGTTSSLVENPMGVLFTTSLAVGSAVSLYGNTFGGSILGTNFQFELFRKFRINTTNGAQRFFILNCCTN